VRRALWVLAVVVSGCGGGTFAGDVRCQPDGGCLGGLCVRVTRVLTPTGQCLASSGADVCRPVCASCPGGDEPCGCVCPP
jgi:hypothetical protein